MKLDSKIRVHVTNQDGELLNSAEYDLVALEKELRKALAKKGASEVLIARDLLGLGDDAGEMVGDEIRAALRRRTAATAPRRKK